MPQAAYKESSEPVDEEMANAADAHGATDREKGKGPQEGKEGKGLGGSHEGGPEAAAAAATAATAAIAAAAAAAGSWVKSKTRPEPIETSSNPLAKDGGKPINVGGDPAATQGLIHSRLQAARSGKLSPDGDALALSLENNPLDKKVKSPLPPIGAGGAGVGGGAGGAGVGGQKTSPSASAFGLGGEQMEGVTGRTKSVSPAGGHWPGLKPSGAAPSNQRDDDDDDAEGEAETLTSLLGGLGGGGGLAAGNRQGSRSLANLGSRPMLPSLSPSTAYSSAPRSMLPSDLSLIQESEAAAAVRCVDEEMAARQPQQILKSKQVMADADDSPSVELSGPSKVRILN